MTDTHNKCIRYAYSKYKASSSALQLYNKIVADGKWPTQYQRVTITEIRQLFVSKSVWHAQYVPCFQGITQYEDMLAWLEDRDASDDESVWGKQKTIFQFCDLKEWLENKKKENKRKLRDNKGSKKTDEKVTKKKKKQ
jgi:hypothetical protein